MRKDVAFACEQFQVSERRACKLLGMDRGSYRYESRADRNGPLREALVALSRQKPRTANRPVPPHAVQRVSRSAFARQPLHGLQLDVPPAPCGRAQADGRGTGAPALAFFGPMRQSSNLVCVDRMPVYRVEGDLPGITMTSSGPNLGDDGGVYGLD
jgi:hypothetical protein